MNLFFFAFKEILADLRVPSVANVFVQKKILNYMYVNILANVHSCVYFADVLLVVSENGKF